jgi:hypothetical protein
MIVQSVPGGNEPCYWMIVVIEVILQRGVIFVFYCVPPKFSHQCCFILKFYITVSCDLTSQHFSYFLPNFFPSAGLMACIFFQINGLVQQSHAILLHKVSQLPSQEPTVSLGNLMIHWGLSLKTSFCKATMVI